MSGFGDRRELLRIVQSPGHRHHIKNRPLVVGFLYVLGRTNKNPDGLCRGSYKNYFDVCAICFKLRA